MTPPPPSLPALLEAAARLLQARRPAEARRLLEQAVAAHPRAGEAWRLLGLAAQAMGDDAGAEAALRRAALPAARVALAELLARTGRTAEAETELRAVLAADRRNGTAAAGLSNLLTDLGRIDEALAITRPMCGPEQTQPSVLAARAGALKAAGDLAGALSLYARIPPLAPRSGVAEHNVAATLADLLDFPGSEAAARRALAKGLDAPETWLVLAHALQGQARYDEAESAYREVVRRRPEGVEAHRELAQLIWMRTADLARAVAALDQALAQAPAATDLLLAKAQLLDYADRPADARALLAAAAGHPGSPPALAAAASHAFLETDPQAALVLAEQALGQAPGNPEALAGLCAARLAMGDGRGAADLAEHLHARAPLDQHAIALLTTAWRMTGDPRRAALCDPAALVRAYDIGAPPGWPDLSAYLADLAAALEAMHGFKTHPVGQSLRHGSQTSVNLRHAKSPAIQAFFAAIDAPIRAHMAWLGAGADPVRARNLGDYEIAGAWSVRLRPGGRHVNHVHPQGWLSSAFYVALPPAVTDDRREGWLQFGKPGIPVAPPQMPEHHVQPAPGRLALFPSYMWHGTTPFSGDGARLTMAFDVKPKPA